MIMGSELFSKCWYRLEFNTCSTLPHRLSSDTLPAMPSPINRKVKCPVALQWQQSFHFKLRATLTADTLEGGIESHCRDKWYICREVAICTGAVPVQDILKIQEYNELTVRYINPQIIITIAHGSLYLILLPFPVSALIWRDKQPPYLPKNAFYPHTHTHKFSNEAFQIVRRVKKQKKNTIYLINRI